MKYLILGSSLRGLADAARLAIADGHEAIAWDGERPGVPDDLAGAVPVLPQAWHRSFLDGIDRVVASPWFPELVPPLSDAIAAGVPIITEAGYGFEHVPQPVVAITGTNGKTTVTEVTTAMLLASGIDALAVGNIGVPVSAVGDHAADVLVAELSSYQLRFIGSLTPVAATILNIADDHLDWHGSHDAYRDAKARIIADVDRTAVFAYNADEPEVAAIAERVPCVLVPCSGRRLPEGGNGVDGTSLVIDGTRHDAAHVDDTYRFNLAVAGTLALAAGGTQEGIAEVVATFRPGEHRREVVATIGGVTFVNDSKATNPHAALAAVASFPSVILLAGGRNKGLDLEPLALAGPLRCLIAFGESGPEIASLAPDGARLVSTMSEAIDTAFAVAEPGDTVLLSPGCASFDEFDGYEHRGRVFRDLVLARQGTAA